MAKVTDRRLYEKTPHHFDLTYCLEQENHSKFLKSIIKFLELTGIWAEAISEQVTELVVNINT